MGTVLFFKIKNITTWTIREIKKIEPSPICYLGGHHYENR
jgi:hypothetical protein